MNYDSINPPEYDEKCYVFTCLCSCKKLYTVYADDIETAERLLYSGEYEEVEEEDVVIEEIESVNESYD